MPSDTMTPANAITYDQPTFQRLLLAYRQLDPRQHPDQAWQLLEAMHVLGQSRLGPHARTHALMLSLAWRTRDLREVLGQGLRLLLTPLGHLTGRLPWGNNGRAHVNAFRPMNVDQRLMSTILAFRQNVHVART